MNGIEIPFDEIEIPFDDPAAAPGLLHLRFRERFLLRVVRRSRRHCIGSDRTRVRRDSLAPSAIRRWSIASWISLFTFRFGPTVESSKRSASSTVTSVNRIFSV